MGLSPAKLVTLSVKPCGQLQRTALGQNNIFSELPTEAGGSRGLIEFLLLDPNTDIKRAIEPVRRQRRSVRHHGPATGLGLSIGGPSVVGIQPTPSHLFKA
jgi:hypothetical protein